MDIEEIKMALSIEQKAINKEATKLRNQAYDARKNEYRVARERAEAEIKGGALFKSAEKANNEFEAALEAKSEELAEIDARIRALNEEYERAKSQHDKKIEPLMEQRTNHRAAYYAALYAANKAVDALFEDVAQCYSAAAWKSFEEFIPGKTAGK